MSRSPPRKLKAEASSENLPVGQSSPISQLPPFPDAGMVPAPSLAMKVIYSPSYKTVYSNSVRMLVSQWDLGIGIGLAGETQGHETVVTEEILVKFSPQFFKAFAGAVSDALKNWEATFGEIPMGLGQARNESGMAVLFQSLKEVLGQASANEISKES